MVRLAKANVYAGIVCMAIALYYLYESVQLPFWSEVGPGAGTLPVLSGVLFGALAVGLIVRNLSPARAEKGEADFVYWRMGAMVLAAVFVLILVTKALGMLLTIFLFMSFHTKFVENRRWIVVVPTALLTSVTFFVIFEMWLDVPLPIGIFGI